MKLYIHFGIYKAGSSYLQYILANSRKFLVREGIYFPYSAQDGRMQKGLISAGNADGLEHALKTKDNSGCAKILKDWLEAGKKQKCDRVLISAEALVHQFALPKAIKTLENAAKEVGYIEIHSLGFFRDLVDHALSTYKYRGKSGKIPDVENWLSNTYETPALLHNLSNVRRNGQNKIVWNFRKFQKDSHYIVHAFFVEWLNISSPSFRGKTEVNESVTLSEVLVMNEMAKCFPLVTDYFVDQFKSLPADKKAKDVQLTHYFNNIAIRVLEQHSDIIKGFNVFFEPEEKLIIGKASKEPVAKIVTLTTGQVNVLGESIKHFQRFPGRWMLLRRKFSKKIPRKMLRYGLRN